MVKKTKGQMKIQQTAFMLIAVTLFFALVGIVVISYKFSGLRDSASTLEERNAILLLGKLADSPEFMCGEGFGGRKINCIDADKALMLKEKGSIYAGFWGDTSIEILKVYPEISNTVECTTGNYPNCNLIKVLSRNPARGQNFYSTFVSLCRKEVFEGRPYNKCEIAKLLVGYSEK